ncbi:hypothetical protein GALMADRAFT_1364541, partial [Galerina marginata CBS 339.88]
KLIVHYVVGRIAESFKTDSFLIWSEDNSKKLVVCCCVLGSPDKEDDGMGSIEEDIFFQPLKTRC